MSPTLRLEALVVGYPRHTVLGPVDATVPPGQLVCLVGPNGSGKSTLLRTAAGLQRTLAGRVLLGDADLAELPRRERARRLAVVLTDRVQVEHLRVDEFVALGRHPHLGFGQRLGRVDRQRVTDCLARVGAQQHGHRLLAELSDGQRQRVVVARALAQEADTLLLDEPSSFLDPAARLDQWALLRELADQGLAVLVSTHEVELALECSDRMWVADDGQVTVGTPDELVAGAAFTGFETTTVHFAPASRRFERLAR